MRYCKLFLLSLVLLGCEMYNQDEYRDLYVVESYLIANRPLPFIRLSTTSPIYKKYRLRDELVKDARVEIRLLKSDRTVARRYRYHGSGTYHPANPDILVKAGRLYQLYIILKNGDVIEAKTRVPGNFKTVEKPEDRYIYQGKEQIKITLTPSSYPGRQAFYVFNVKAIEPQRDKLTSFYADLVEKENLYKSYFINSSGIVNETSLKKNDGGTLTINIPWLLVAFYGKNDVVVNTIDDNMYDFLRSQNVQTNGLQLLPGEVHNMNYNINGAIGIFGSMTSDTNTVVITK